MAKSHRRTSSCDINKSKHGINKHDINKINYKVRLSLKFWINVLTSSKNNICYSAEDHGAHIGVEDKGAYNKAEV